MKFGSIFSLLIVLAFWTASPSSAPTLAATFAQNSTATTKSKSRTQNNVASSSRSTIPEAGPLRGPVQPVPFSHKQHVGMLKMQCEYCHTLSRSGETLTIPRASFCMQCHQTIATANPGVQKLADYAKADRTIPWVRIYELPSFVSFSHKVHLQHGAICEECHGAVAQRVRLFKESDISMATCVNCHRARQASTGCSTCHMLEQ